MTQTSAVSSSVKVLILPRVLWVLDIHSRAFGARSKAQPSLALPLKVYDEPAQLLQRLHAMPGFLGLGPAVTQRLIHVVGFTQVSPSSRPESKADTRQLRGTVRLCLVCRAKQDGEVLRSGRQSGHDQHHPLLARTSASATERLQLPLGGLSSPLRFHMSADADERSTTPRSSPWSPPPRPRFHSH